MTKNELLALLDVERCIPVTPPTLHDWTPAEQAQHRATLIAALRERSPYLEPDQGRIGESS